MALITAKTATPTIFVDTVLPGRSSASGWVGTYDDTGTPIPEPNAYIYIYINGFLINPPELNLDGSFSDLRTIIISDDNGYWSTNSFFFSVYAPFQYGQSFVVRAKAPFKNISDRSVPYAIGSTPTPVELGIRGEFGILRPPYDGEAVVTGKISYWTNNVTGEPLFDCDNHVYIYVDGVRVGEVLNNEILGSNASYPLTETLKNKSLALRVARNTVVVPLDPLNIDDQVPLLGVQDNVNNSFIYFFPTVQAYIKVFRNGLRQQEGLDYTIVEDFVTRKGTVNFASPPTPDDVLTGLLAFQSPSLRLNELPIEVPDGFRTTFSVSTTPKTDTLEVYQNGIHLTGLGAHDYVLNRNVVTFNNAPATDDSIRFDYQPATTNDALIKTQIPVISTIDSLVYCSFNEFPTLGNFHVFVNGVLQHVGTNLDYIKIDDQTIKFNPWMTPSPDDMIIIQFYAAPITIEQLIDYLNQRSEFQDNCLTATKYLPIKPDNFAPLKGTKNSNNTIFTFMIPDQAVVLRVWKNGLRQAPNPDVGLVRDYSVDYVNGTVTFTDPPAETDILLGVFQYATPDKAVILNEIPFNSPYDTDNTIFALANIPIPSTVQIYRNGVRLFPYNNYDYTVSAIRPNEIIFDDAISDTDFLLVDYQPAYVSETLLSSQVPVGPIDGINRIYAFTSTGIGSTLMVFRNGMLQANDYDYSVNRNTLSFSSSVPGGNPPQPQDVVLIDINSSTLVTSDAQDQLSIVSPNELDLYTDLSAFHVPAVTIFPLVVDITDPALVSVSSFFVELSIVHPRMNELKIRLLPPTTTGQPPIILVNNRVKADGTVDFQVGMSGSDLNKTIFDQAALSSIYNNLGGQRSVGHFRPEQGSLNNFLGLTPEEINGTWYLEITDFRNGAVGTLGDFRISFNPQGFNVSLSSANQPFTSTGGLINDATIDSGPYYEVNNLLFGNAPTLYPGRDKEGNFMFSFNRKTSYWRYTNYNPITNVITPFVKQQHITARALNPTPFTYRIS